MSRYLMIFLTLGLLASASWANSDCCTQKLECCDTKQACCTEQKASEQELPECCVKVSKCCEPKTDCCVEG